MRLILLLSISALLMSCEVFNSTNDQKNIDLVEAIEMWNSNNKQSYTFDISRTCECLPPYKYSVEVVNDEIIDVHFEKNELQSYESDEMIIQSTRTIDELFVLLEQYEKAADHFEVEFHKELGYPTKINIDPSKEMADEEIILEIEDLVFINN